MNCREALMTVLDQVDYTSGACALTEMVGAVLPKEVIKEARLAIAKDLSMTQDPKIALNKKVIEVRYPNPLFPSIIVTVAIEKEGNRITQDDRVSIMTKLSEAMDQINAFSKERKS